jgi:hypothetical protein
MITDKDINEFQIWFNNGVDRGWISEMTCATHDGIEPISQEEIDEWEKGGDPCQFVVRILE